MPKDYDKIYAAGKSCRGSKPSELVRQFAELAPTGRALDLGMGEGRDVLYLAGQGYEVTGVGPAESDVARCQRVAREKNLNVKAVCGDARQFKIAKQKYAIITAIHLFQFMTKDDAVALMEGIVYGLKKGGLFLCQTFTIDDPSYKERKRRSKETAPGVFEDAAGNPYSLYEYGELLRLCSDLRPIYYREYDWYDTRRPPAHWHGVVDFVGKKM